MKQLFLLLTTVACCMTVSATAQSDSLYLDSGYRRVVREQAYYRIPLLPLADGTCSVTLRDADGRVLFTGHFIPYKDSFIEHGIFTYYYPEGLVESTGHYDRGVRVGNWQRFAADGTTRPDRFYSETGAEKLRTVLGITGS